LMSSLFFLVDIWILQEVENLAGYPVYGLDRYPDIFFSRHLNITGSWKSGRISGIRPGPDIRIFFLVDIWILQEVENLAGYPVYGLDRISGILLLD
jgi:hypothetical protein